MKSVPKVQSRSSGNYLIITYKINIHIFIKSKILVTQNLRKNGNLEYEC